jgi:hypothetical protein
MRSMLNIREKNKRTHEPEGADGPHPRDKLLVSERVHVVRHQEEDGEDEPEYASRRDVEPLCPAVLDDKVLLFFKKMFS